MLLKLNASYDLATRIVSYQHPYKPIDLKTWIGKHITLQISEKTTCLGCLKVKKTQRGHCYLCSQKLARCDQCFLNPHLCHFQKGTCREPAWAEEVCNKEHIVYLALTSHPKIGITKVSQVPTRWIDQGASWAKILIRTATRREAGLVEKDLTDLGWKGQSQWRDLLKGITSVDPEDMPALYEQALSDATLSAQNRALSYRILPCDNKVFTPIYPLECFLDKAKSLSFPGQYCGILRGIRGQYLFFDDGAVNMRSYEGHDVILEVIP